MILVEHVSVKCSIQKIFIEFLIILTQFKKNINFLKTQTYSIKFCYDYKNKEQILLNKS